MTIVMGLDQHRAQITAEWLDTETGEVSRGRVVPAHRESVRRFLERFRGQELEAALEATTGWRFVVEELRRAGAGAHLAEPAETSAMRGNKKRAKNDRAAPGICASCFRQAGCRSRGSGPITSLICARGSGSVIRSSTIAASGSSGCKLCSITTGCQKRADLLTRENRAWVQELPLPAVGREQIAVGLAVIDAINLRLAPFDRRTQRR